MTRDPVQGTSRVLHVRLALPVDIDCKMLWCFRFIAVSVLTHPAAAQYYEGYEGDKPMLMGPPRTGPGAMLRFGCSQVVIERLDP